MVSRLNYYINTSIKSRKIWTMYTVSKLVGTACTQSPNTENFIRHPVNKSWDSHPISAKKSLHNFLPPIVFNYKEGLLYRENKRKNNYLLSLHHNCILTITMFFFHFVLAWCMIYFLTFPIFLQSFHQKRCIMPISLPGFFSFTWQRSRFRFWNNSKRSVP